ncbi:MAG TPA: hypothetical protein VGM44_19220 [Polyangiaceae bacterium]
MARAETPDLVALEWDAPAGCPSAEQVRAKIRRLAGTLAQAATPLSAEATIEHKDDDSFHLRLVIHAGSVVGERNIDAKSCDDLAGATAVALALLLHSSTPLAAGDLEGANATRSDGTATNGSPQAENPNKKTEPSAAAPKPQPPTPAEPAREPQPETRASRSWHGLLQLPLGTASLGPLPKPNLGVAFAAGLALDRWRFLAQAALWQKQKTSATFQAAQYDAESARLSATLSACRALSLSRFELAPCLTLALEHISATGSGPHIVPRTATSTWLAPGVGAALRFYVAPWFCLAASANAALETARPEISLAGVGRVAQLSAAAATVTIGPEWIL